MGAALLSSTAWWLRRLAGKAVWHAALPRGGGGTWADRSPAPAALSPPASLAAPLGPCPCPADNTPDARDSAKKVIGLLKAAFADPAVEAQLAVEVPAPAAPAEGEEAPKQPTKWEAYCQASLSVSAALAVLKASSE